MTPPLKLMPTPTLPLLSTRPIFTYAPEAWPTFEMVISPSGIAELLSFTSGDSSWTTVESADTAVAGVGIVCSGLPGSFSPSTVELLLFGGITSVLLVSFRVFLGRPQLFTF